MPLIPEQHQKKAAWLTICAACVAGYEATRTTPYYDIVGIPTVCDGETKGVKMTDRYTPAQCQAMLEARLDRDFGPGVDKCITHPLPPERKAAYVSTAYNIGTGGFCASSAAKYENAGDPVRACLAVMDYVKVKIKGVLTFSRGLWNRRVGERGLCLKGIPRPYTVLGLT